MSKITEVNNLSKPDDYFFEVIPANKHNELLQRLKSQHNVDNSTRYAPLISISDIFGVVSATLIQI